MDSILTSIKKLLGIAEDYTHFDPDITIHINSVFSILNQLGVGPSSGFVISDKTALWTSFIQGNAKIELVRTYMYQKVKLIFDPPLSPALIESLKQQIAEFEWRANVSVGPVTTR